MCGHQSPDRPSLNVNLDQEVSKGLSSLQLHLRLLWCLSIAQTHQHVFQAGLSTTYLLRSPLKKPHELGGTHLSHDPSASDWSGSGLQDSITEHNLLAGSFFSVTETANRHIYKNKGLLCLCSKDWGSGAPSAGSSTGSRVSFPGDSLGLNFFQAPWLGSASSRQLVWSKLLGCSSVSLVSEGQGSFIAYSGREGLVNLFCFRDFLKHL